MRKHSVWLVEAFGYCRDVEIGSFVLWNFVVWSCDTLENNFEIEHKL